MRRFFIAALAVASISAPVGATDVGVSVNIGQPGFYGQLDIGGFPRPALLYPQPIVVHRVPVGRAPVYLHVPPDQARHWRKHCHRYNACGQRVYFVQNDWYDREYAPRYQERHGGRHGHDRDYYRDDYRRDGRHDHRGHGHDKGHDHDKRHGGGHRDRDH